MKLSAPPIDWDVQVSLKYLAESMPIAVVIVNSRGKITYVNARLEEMFGYQPDGLVGHDVEVLLPQQFRQAHVQHRLGYMEHPHVRIMGSGLDLVGRRKDGSEFPLEAGLSSLTLNSETFVVATVTDVSKRKQAERLLEHQIDERTQEVLRRQEIAESLRSILTTLIINRSLVESLDFIADEAARLLATDLCIIYGRDERHGHLHPLVEKGIVPVELDKTFIQNLARESCVFEVPVVVRPDKSIEPAFSDTGTNATHIAGDNRWLYLTVPVRDTQVYGLMLFGFNHDYALLDQDVDLSLRMADLTVLAFANAHLRAQIEHSAVAAERSRIARDLHDAVTQTLFSASIIAGVLPNIWQRNQEEGFKRLDELRELTRGALAEMRTLLLELRPAKLVEVDLADLLRQLAEAISGRARVPVTVHVEGGGDISADVKVALYRVAQEALNNIAKHAQARNVLIHLRHTQEQIMLSVSDDGVGFVFERIAPQHLGLGIMRERADAIGASLSVISAPMEGTTIAVCWNTDQSDA